VPTKVKGSDRFLWHGPIAGGWVQIRVDRTRLHVVDSDATAPDHPGQTLGTRICSARRYNVEAHTTTTRSSCFMFSGVAMTFVLKIAA
jgi:hypothetical protein